MADYGLLANDFGWCWPISQFLADWPILAIHIFPEPVLSMKKKKLILVNIYQVEANILFKCHLKFSYYNSLLNVTDLISEEWYIIDVHKNENSSYQIKTNL